MANLIQMPMQLHRMATDATMKGREMVLIPASDLKLSAEAWHADKEKIAYLESLIVKIGRA